MILLAHKLKTVISETTTGNGSTSVTIENEQAAALITLNVTAVTGSAKIILQVYAVGDSDERLIYSTETYRHRTVEPLEFSVQSGSKIRVDTFYTGVVSYEVRAKALAVLPLATTIATVDSDDEIAWRQTVESQLAVNNQLLGTILNHLRAITGIEDNIGEDY